MSTRLKIFKPQVQIVDSEEVKLSDQYAGRSSRNLELRANSRNHKSCLYFHAQKVIDGLSRIYLQARFHWSVMDHVLTCNVQLTPRCCLECFLNLSHFRHKDFNTTRDITAPVTIDHRAHRQVIVQSASKESSVKSLPAVFVDSGCLKACLTKHHSPRLL
jgi:hypothetical protein